MDKGNETYNDTFIKAKLELLHLIEPVDTVETVAADAQALIDAQAVIESHAFGGQEDRVLGH